MSRFFVRQEALDDIASAIEWYERQQPGVGQSFAQTFTAVLGHIQQNPLMFPKLKGRYRKAVLKKYPYVIYYSVDQDAVIVFAVLHGHRRPSRWRDRL